MTAIVARQAFGLSFLASSKILVLIASTLKAARVRRRMRAMRVDYAARRVAAALRWNLALRKIERLQEKHAASRAASREALEALARQRGGAVDTQRLGTAGAPAPAAAGMARALVSLPEQLSQHGNKESDLSSQERLLGDLDEELLTYASAAPPSTHAFRCA